jgi:hypothetical protein
VNLLSSLQSIKDPMSFRDRDGTIKSLRKRSNQTGPILLTIEEGFEIQAESVFSGADPFDSDSARSRFALTIRTGGQRVRCRRFRADEVSLQEAVAAARIWVTR